MNRSFISRDNEPLMATGRTFHGDTLLSSSSPPSNQYVAYQQQQHQQQRQQPTTAANNTQPLKIEMQTGAQEPTGHEQTHLASNNHSHNNDNDNNNKKRRNNNSNNKLTLDPSGAFCHHWSMCVSLAFLYNFWSLSYRFAFKEINNESVYAWFALDYTADVIYALDIVVGFRTGYLEDGVLQTDCEKLRQHYINCNAFYIDCFCLLPLDFLYLSIGFNSVLRCTRLVKIYRFWHYSDRTERHTNYPNVYRTFALVHYIVVIIHWNACLVHMIASDRSLFGFHISPQLYRLSLPPTSGVITTATMHKQPRLIVTQTSHGIDQHDEVTSASAAASIIHSSSNNHTLTTVDNSNDDNNNNHDQHQHHSGLETIADSAIVVDADVGIDNNNNKCIDDAHDVLCQYLHAFYWSTQALTLVADLPRPVTKSDYMFLLVEFIFGLFLFAAVLGHVANIVTNVSAGRREFQAKLDAVKTYMRMRRVSGPLQHKVIKWFDYLWVTQKSSDDDKSVACLPDRLKAEIAIHVHLDTLKRVEIFQNTEAGFLCELVLRLKPVLFSPGDYVCRKNEVGHEMYIVNRGRLEVVADNGTTVLATLDAGSYFGEISILNVGAAGNKRTASVRSLGYTDLFCLSKQDLWDVLKDYPAAEARIRTRAEKRLSKLDLNPQSNNANATIGSHTPIASDNTNLAHNTNCTSKRLNNYDLNLPSHQTDRGATSLRSRSFCNCSGLHVEDNSNNKKRMCRHLATTRQHRYSSKPTKCQQSHSGITDATLINSAMSVSSSSSTRSSLQRPSSASSTTSSSSSSMSTHSLVPSVTPSMSLSMAAGIVPTNHWSGSSSALLAANRALLTPSQHESHHDRSSHHHHHHHHHRHRHHGTSLSVSRQQPMMHSHTASLTHRNAHRHTAHSTIVTPERGKCGEQLNDQLAQYLLCQAHNQHHVDRQYSSHHRHLQDNSLAHRLLHTAPTSSVSCRSSRRHARQCCGCFAPTPGAATAPTAPTRPIAQFSEPSNAVAATRAGTQSEMQIAPPEVSVTGASEPASPCATPSIDTFQSISTNMLPGHAGAEQQPRFTGVSSTRSLILQSTSDTDKDGTSPVGHHSSNC